MAKLTIIDIAKMAGVSPSTVSLVINKRPNVSAQTREKVLEVINKTNFVPSQSARNQIMKKTQNIALIYGINIHPLDHMFHESLNKCILDYCMKNHYNLVFVACEYDNDSFVVPPVLLSHGADGIISFGYMPESVIGDILKLDIPYVQIDSHQSFPASANVSVDYYKAACLAMDYLIGHGHRKIAYIGSNFPLRYSKQTFDGYRASMGEIDFQVPMKWIQMQSRDIDGDDSAESQMLSILENDERPTAVFCGADIYAIGAIRAIKKKGLRVPDDISVIGIDDLPIDSYIDPPLTSVHVDTKELSDIGCDMLFKKIAHSEAIQDNIVYSDFSISERASVSTIKTL